MTGTLSTPDSSETAAQRGLIVPASLGSDEIGRIRADFPILDQEVNGHPLAYLDSGATSQKPQTVIDAELEVYQRYNAAVHRGAHYMAAVATDLYEQARADLGAFTGVSAEETVWTKNASEALNLAAYFFINATAGRGGTAAERYRLQPGDEIVITEMEHHSNIVPWQEVALHTGATLKAIPLTDEGRLDLETAKELIGPRTKVLAFTHVSNVLGTVNPVKELTQWAHAVGAIVVLDACQSVPRLPVDFKDLDVDFAAYSGHKMLGPSGIGVLYGKADFLEAAPPVLTGGSMISTVTIEHTDFADPPQRFEAGTQPLAQIVGLRAAAEYLQHIGLDKVQSYEEELAGRLLEQLRDIPGVRLIGPDSLENRAAAVSFDVEGVHAHDVGQYLDDRGIAVRVGHHCAHPLHKRYGVTATTRATPYLYNTVDEIDRLTEALSEVRPFFGVR